VDALINVDSFSSLSSGDYTNILELTDYFNKKYKNQKISFSLPSIKVETFDTNILEQLATTRRSGITFAIESGDIEGQISINKVVLLSKVKSIIEYAVKNGYKLMKFYFMIGLPHIENEKESIIDFIDNVLKMDKKLILNVNISTFVPRPHTPYQNERQLKLEESIKILNEIKENYKRTRVNIKIHNPYMSYIEGLLHEEMRK